jgi:quercetin dioxygenase-like cupin family protein
MQHDQFALTVVSEGYAAPVMVTREANGQVDTHSHPFAAKALIVAGEIRIVAEQLSATYKPGDVFQLDANKPHQEYYGPEGVTYYVGRKSPGSPA